MKKVCLVVLLAVGVFGNQAVAQTQVKNGAQISVNEDVHDYGTVEFGGDGVCYFEVTNTGNAPLILSNVKGSCQCTVPTWPKEPIAPGKTAKIKVKYNTSRAGAINKSVTITSNATDTPTKVVRIKGNVTAKPADGVPVNKGGPKS
ncbi:MAG: hypothetical protein ACJASQ_003145 [Crocinitomicaceae bacterium]|jgi:hypothetical protein